MTTETRKIGKKTSARIVMERPIFHLNGVGRKIGNLVEGVA
jgi:hypothetical protein